MKTFIAKDVLWDKTDEEGNEVRVNLPNEFHLSLPDDTTPGEAEEIISDCITNDTGFLHKGFTLIEQ